MRSRVLGGASLLVVPLLVVSATASSAAPAGVDVDDVATVIEQAVPADQVAVVEQPDSVAAGLVWFESDGQGQLDVEVSLDAGVPVVIDNDVDSPVEISLPSEVMVADGEVASDGTVVFAADRGDAHAAVQVLDDGLRLQTVLEGPEAPSTYSYEFGTGVEPVLMEDGSVELVEQVNEGISVVVGTLDAPWAVDANGGDVSTHYTVDGSTLVQHVEHSASSAYPITADPRVTVGRSIYIYLNTTDQKALKNGLAAAITAGVCALPAVGWGSCVAVAAVVAIGATYLAKNGFCTGSKKTLELRTGGWRQNAGAKCVK